MTTEVVSESAIGQLDRVVGRTASVPRGSGRESAVDRELESWDSALLEAGGHMLQSWRWGALKERHGWQVERVRLDGADGFGLAQILFKRRGPFSLAYVPRGPAILGGEATTRALMAAVDDCCHDHRALSLIVEPDRPLALSGRLRQAGFVRGPDHFQPVRTVKVPLLDDESLVAQMHAKTRYNLRLAQRRGVVVERAVPDAAAVTTFYNLLSDTSGRNEFGIHARAYYDDFVGLFRDSSVLLFAFVDGAIAAGAIAACFGDEGVYMYGASSTKHRAHAAGFLLQFEAMRWARERGCTRYDLWGIPAEDPPTVGNDQGDRVASSRGDDRRGLYEFKIRFGGEIVSYPPTLERRYRPVLGWLARRVYRGRLGGG